MPRSSVRGRSDRGTCVSSTHSTIGQAICGKPGTKWCSRTEKPGMRFTGLGMMPAPSGNSPIARRCGVTSPPKRPRISRSASGWIFKPTSKRGRGALARMVVRRRADAAEAEHHVRRSEAALQCCGDALGLVAQIVRPGKTKPPLGEGFDHERQVLVLALSDEDLVPDDESAEQLRLPFFDPALAGPPGRRCACR